MKFLCDVHISYKLVKFIQLAGYEAIHVNEILDKWNTKDSDICAYADANNLIVITKDPDFRDSFFIKRSPGKLIKINLGNITNTELLEIFSSLLQEMTKIDLAHPFMIEIDKGNINYVNLDK
jgi:predicted nuclease of predicted toxin-antitoxin system